MTFGRLAPPLIALALLLAATAQAQPTGFQRVFQDDRNLVDGPPAVRDRALDELAALGVDIVRVNLIWRRIHPRRAALQEWARYDATVAAIAARGMRPLLTLTTPAPSWAADALTPQFPGARDPDPKAFGRFARDAGARYGPALRPLWSVVNEPNNPRYLGPQRVKGRLVAPGLYRGLARAAVAGLAATGHRPADVLLGELLAVGRPRGAATVPISPVTFMRELFCLDRRDRPRRGCEGRRFAPLDAGGVAFHPYYLRGGPQLAPRSEVDITPAHLRVLQRTLRAAHRHGRTVRPLPLWDTEDGIQTDPPDDLFGVRPGLQARFINETEWILWNTPGVRSAGQYVWADERPLRAFQSGLRTFAGEPKPALAAYRLPLVVTRVGARAHLWGRIPPRSPEREVTVLLAGGGRRTVTVPASSNGYFTLFAPLRPGSFRLLHDGALSRRAVPGPVSR